MPTIKDLKSVEAENARLRAQLAEAEAKVAAKESGGYLPDPVIESYEGHKIFVIKHTASTPGGKKKADGTVTKPYTKMDIRIGLNKAMELLKHETALKRFVKSQGKSL